MLFPLSFLDVSIWLGITAIILLATLELLSPRYGYDSPLIDRKRLKITGFVVGTLFMLTVTVQIILLIVRT